MRFSLSTDKQTSIRYSQRWSWLEFSVLIMLTAAILRLGSDLVRQWRHAAERIGLVEADLHARSEADYSTDPAGIYIPPLDPAILLDLLGEIPALFDLPFSLPGGIPGLPNEPENETLVPKVSPTRTPTIQVPDHTKVPTYSFTATGTLPGLSSPTSTQSPTLAPGTRTTATPTSTTRVTATSTPHPTSGISPTATSTRTNVPSHTPTRTSVHPTTEVPAPTTGVPTTEVPQPTTIVPTTEVPQPTTAVPTTVAPPPTTVVPPSRTPTPFATRNPTNAVTPTAFYTPGGTTAPITIVPPPQLLPDHTPCPQVGNIAMSGNGCLAQADLNGGIDQRSLWQKLLVLLHLNDRREIVDATFGD